MWRLIRHALVALVLSGIAPALASQQATGHPRLVSAESAQCGICHEELLADRSHPHPPAVEDCTTCHEISVSDEGTSVALMDSEPALCVFCHDDKEAAVELELETPHLPAADSCLTCHDPHASENEHVLLAPPAELCAECHDIDDLDDSHGGQITAATDCAACHNPHGSPNPRMLVASRLHPPFEEGSCAGCHRQPFGDQIRLRARAEKLCTACHGDFPEHPGGSVHAALRGERGRAGCLSCHNPHMSDHRAVLLSDANSLCARCHADVVLAASADTGHYPAGEDCLNCHQPHTAEQQHLLVEARGELCTTCHDLEAAPAPTPAAAIEVAGAGGASFGPAPLISAADFGNGTDEPGLCAAPFPEGTWSGQIVLCDRGGVPRTLKSQNVKAGGAGGLILANRVASVDDLIAEAHAVPTLHIGAADGQRVRDWLGAEGQHRARIEPGRLYLEPTGSAGPGEGDLVTAHLGADLSRLDCLACHDPHGTGNPKLLAVNLHPPLEDGCDTCHEGSFDRLMEGGAPDLCLFCHEDPAEEPAVPHGAMELGVCTDCHNPHATAQDKLVKAPGAGPCADCHDEQVAGPGEVAHGVIELVGCRACHEPHGGEREKLLRLSGSDLCLSCHGRAAASSAPNAESVLLMGRFEIPARDAASLGRLSFPGGGASNHPVTGHRALGTPTAAELSAVEVEFSGELTCLTCHDPHKGRTAKLFQWNAVNNLQVCQNCHKK